jgi:hypothetical protein
MNKYDQLLLYLSELRAGSWESFSHAVKSLALPDAIASTVSRSPYFVSEDLSWLGHVEFLRAQGDVDGGWQTAVPCLVEVEAKHGSVGVLAGARPYGLMLQIADGGFAPRVVLKAPSYGPSVIAIHTSGSDELRKASAELEIEFAPRFSQRLSTLLPTTKDTVASAPVEPPPRGWETTRLDERTLNWQDCTSDTQDGLYRYCRFTTEYRLVLDGTPRVVERSVGVYERLRIIDRAVVQYDPKMSVLSVPGRAGLPPLAARAATMCSGALPVVEHRNGLLNLSFENVPEKVAVAIEASLS